MAKKTLELEVRPTNPGEMKKYLDGIGMSVDQVKKKLQEIPKSGGSIANSPFAQYAESLKKYDHILNPKGSGGGADGGGGVIGNLFRGEVPSALKTGGVAAGVILAAGKAAEAVNDARDAKTGNLPTGFVNKYAAIGQNLAQSIPIVSSIYNAIGSIHEFFTGAKAKTAKILEGVKADDIKMEFIGGMKKAMRLAFNDLEASQVKNALTRHELSFGDQAFNREQAGIEDAGEAEKYTLGKQTQEAILQAREDRNAKAKEIDELNLSQQEKSGRKNALDTAMNQRISQLQDILATKSADIDETTAAKLQEQQRAATKALTVFNRDQEMTTAQHYVALGAITLQLMGYNRQAELTAINQKYDEQIVATTVKYDEMAKTVSDAQAKELMIKKKAALDNLEQQRQIEQQQMQERRRQQQEEEQRTGSTYGNMLALRLGNTFNLQARTQISQEQAALSAFRAMQASADAIVKSKSATPEEKAEAQSQLAQFITHIGSTIAQMQPLEQKKLSDGTEQKALSGFTMANKSWEVGTREDYQRQLVGENKALNDKLAKLTDLMQKMFMFQQQAWQRAMHDNQ